MTLILLQRMKLRPLSNVRVGIIRSTATRLPHQVIKTRKKKKIARIVALAVMKKITAGRKEKVSTVAKAREKTIRWPSLRRMKMMTMMKMKRISLIICSYLALKYTKINHYFDL